MLNMKRLLGLFWRNWPKIIQSAVSISKVKSTHHQAQTPDVMIYINARQIRSRTSARIPLTKIHGTRTLFHRYVGVASQFYCKIKTNKVRSTWKFRPVPSEQLPPGIASGYQFTSVCINPPIYLSWLVGQCLKNGAVFKRGVLKDVGEAAHLHHSGRKADVVVNCTGLSSKFLGGVRDDKLRPARGQVVVVRNDPGAMVAASIPEEGMDDEKLYMMTRAAGGGTILGGCFQEDKWDPLPDPNLAVRIMKRAIQVRPQLVAEGQGIEGLDIIRHGVGLRPLRDGGPRIEREVLSDGLSVVMNYGHGGYGYQSSYGCARAAVDLVKTSLQDRARPKL